MSDRFTRDPQHRPEDRELALRLREQMRAAVTRVRAGPSVGAGTGEQETAPVDDGAPTVRRIDGHPVR